MIDKSSLSSEEINRIFDLMKVDSNNFHHQVSDELLVQLSERYRLTLGQLKSMEIHFFNAFSSVYQEVMK